MLVKIYTCITPNYDFPQSDILQIPPSDIFIKPVLNAKIVKVLSHQYIYSDVSVWIDGSIYLYPNFDPISLLEDYDIVLIKHPQRDCIYDEIKPAKNRITHDQEEQIKIEAQIEYYKSINFPPNYGLWCGGFIIRRRNQRVIEFNNDWWSEICRFSYRDQLSLPVVLSRNPKLKLKTLDINLYNNKIFKKKKHEKQTA